MFYTRSSCLYQHFFLRSVRESTTLTIQFALLILSCLSKAQNSILYCLEHIWSGTNLVEIYYSVWSKILRCFRIIFLYICLDSFYFLRTCFWSNWTLCPFCYVGFNIHWFSVDETNIDYRCSLAYGCQLLWRYTYVV